MFKLVYLAQFVSFCVLWPLNVQAEFHEKTTEKLRYNLVEGLPDIFIHPETEKIGCTWANGYVWDKPLIQKFYSILPKNDFFVMIDLGAQTGSFSLLAKYFPNSKCYAFEPIEEAADLLKENLKINDIHNVFVQQMAVSDYAGMATLTMPDKNDWGLSTLGSNVVRFEPLLQRNVPCIDLDRFVELNQIQRVHFMKIDTEGSEFSILRGARKLLMRDHPILLIEFNERNMSQCGVTKVELEKYLEELGYTWTLVSTEDILCTPLL